MKKLDAELINAQWWDAEEMARLVLAGADDPRIRWGSWESGVRGAHLLSPDPPANLPAPDDDAAEAAWESWRAAIRQHNELLATAMRGIGWEQVDGWGTWYPAEMAAWLRRKREWWQAQRERVDAALRRV